MSKLASPTFVLYRILGNDMPPIHSLSQTLDNLQFILKNEPPLENCSKRFILNRIIDPDRVKALRGLLAAAGHPVDEIPFERDVYRGLADPQHRSNYLTNNNPGRNFALKLGVALADYVLPFDGQIFMPEPGWQDIRLAVAEVPECPAWLVPMVRLLTNEEALQPTPVDRDEAEGQSEPQVFFARNSEEQFDESLPYGSAPKQEMLIRLGVPGPWQFHPGPFWEGLRSRPRSKHVDQALQAGKVYRLASGNPVATIQNSKRRQVRLDSVVKFREKVDRVFGVTPRP
ncbi:MAG: hypothetical protein K8T20_08695 [Planctomycetes bacterium]|nr:hypothetical protein [Planctomycetota bacterium]